MKAHYEPGPYGALLVASGTCAYDNLFRFSTKYADDETDLVYYGYRYYAAAVGRWTSRDPIEEAGGLSLCAFAGNDLVNNNDAIGAGLVISEPDMPEPTEEDDVQEVRRLCDNNPDGCYKGFLRHRYSYSPQYTPATGSCCCKILDLQVDVDPNTVIVFSGAAQAMFDRALTHEDLHFNTWHEVWGSHVVPLMTGVYTEWKKKHEFPSTSPAACTRECEEKIGAALNDAQTKIEAARRPLNDHVDTHHAI